MRRTALIVDADRDQLASTVRTLRALDAVIARRRDAAALLDTEELSLLTPTFGQPAHLAFRARAHPPHRLVITDRL